jgi:hypothetical protein
MNAIRKGTKKLPQGVKPPCWGDIINLPTDSLIARVQRNLERSKYELSMGSFTSSPPPPAIKTMRPQARREALIQWLQDKPRPNLDIQREETPLIQTNVFTIAVVQQIVTVKDEDENGKLTPRKVVVNLTNSQIKPGEKYILGGYVGHKFVSLNAAIKQKKNVEYTGFSYELAMRVVKTVIVKKRYTDKESGVKMEKAHKAKVVIFEYVPCNNGKPLNTNWDENTKSSPGTKAIFDSLKDIWDKNLFNPNVNNRIVPFFRNILMGLVRRYTRDFNNPVPECYSAFELLLFFGITDPMTIGKFYERVKVDENGTELSDDEIAALTDEQKSEYIQAKEFRRAKTQSYQNYKKYGELIQQAGFENVFLPLIAYYDGDEAGFFKFLMKLASSEVIDAGRGMSSLDAMVSNGKNNATYGDLQAGETDKNDYEGLQDARSEVSANLDLGLADDGLDFDDVGIDWDDVEFGESVTQIGDDVEFGESVTQIGEGRLAVWFGSNAKKALDAKKRRQQRGCNRPFEGLGKLLDKSLNTISDGDLEALRVKNKTRETKAAGVKVAGSIVEKIDAGTIQEDTGDRLLKAQEHKKLLVAGSALQALQGFHKSDLFNQDAGYRLFLDAYDADTKSIDLSKLWYHNPAKYKFDDTQLGVLDKLMLSCLEFCTSQTNSVDVWKNVRERAIAAKNIREGLAKGDANLVQLWVKKENSLPFVYINGGLSGLHSILLSFYAAIEQHDKKYEWDNNLFMHNKFKELGFAVKEGTVKSSRGVSEGASITFNIFDPSKTQLPVGMIFQTFSKDCLADWEQVYKDCYVGTKLFFVYATGARRSLYAFMLSASAGVNVKTVQKVVDTNNKLVGTAVQGRERLQATSKDDLVLYMVLRELDKPDNLRVRYRNLFNINPTTILGNPNILYCPDQLLRAAQHLKEQAANGKKLEYLWDTLPNFYIAYDNPAQKLDALRASIDGISCLVDKQALLDIVWQAETQAIELYDVLFTEYVILESLKGSVQFNGFISGSDKGL